MPPVLKDQQSKTVLTRQKQSFGAPPLARRAGATIQISSDTGGEEGSSSHSGQWPHRPERIHCILYVLHADCSMQCCNGERSKRVECIRADFHTLCIKFIFNHILGFVHIFSHNDIVWYGFRPIHTVWIHFIQPKSLSATTSSSTY